MVQAGRLQCLNGAYLSELSDGLAAIALSPAFSGTSITREDVKRLTYGLLARGRSRGTAKWVLTPLSGMFSMAAEDGHLVPGGNRSEVDRLDDPIPATVRNLSATASHKAGA